MTAFTVKLERSKMSGEPRTKIVLPDSVKETNFVLQDEYGPEGS